MLQGIRLIQAFDVERAQVCVGPGFGVVVEWGLDLDLDAEGGGEGMVWEVLKPRESC